MVPSHGVDPMGKVLHEQQNPDFLNLQENKNLFEKLEVRDIGAKIQWSKPRRNDFCLRN